jgi:hypothetical protein
MDKHREAGGFDFSVCEIVAFAATGIFASASVSTSLAVLAWNIR